MRLAPQQPEPVRRQPSQQRERATPQRAAHGPTRRGADLVSLQRTIGNAAVGRLLSAPPRVQRKVGFELEDANWVPWVKEAGRDLRPARRKTDKFATEPGHFTLEADDTGGPNRPSIEFVTSPFDTDASGLSESGKAFREMSAIMARLGPLAKRRGPVEDENGLQLANPDPNRFVLPAEHGLSPTLWLSGGASEAKFKMQATHGVSLEDIPTVLKYFGTSVRDETRTEAAERQPARQLMYGDGPEQAIARLVGDAPRLGEVALGELTDRLPQPLLHETAALRGLLTQLVLYVKGLTIRQVISQGVMKPAKYNIPFLARTDFSAQFALLHPDVQALLRQDRAGYLADAVAAAAASTSILPSTVRGTFTDTGFRRDTPLLPDPRWGLNSLTLRDWLEGFTRERAPVDYLNAQNIVGWLAAQGINDAQEVLKRQAVLESFGAVGEEASSQRTDAPDIAGHSRLAIIENRGISGGNLSMDDAFTRANNYLKFFVNLREGRGEPGAFPTAAPPRTQPIGEWLSETAADLTIRALSWAGLLPFG